MIKQIHGTTDLMGIFSRKSHAPDSMQADAAAHNAAMQAVFDYKATALQNASETAQAEGRKPTMTDYFIAAEQLGQQQSKTMAAQGIQWTPTVISDLSGQTINGFQVNKADMEPPADLQAFALQQAATQAQTQGRAVTRLDMLKALQQIQRDEMPVPPMTKTVANLQQLQGVEGMKDLMDLDGDHVVNKFFADIDRHAKFEKTIFANVSFHPAGTLMRDGENGVPLTEGASFSNVKFDGMGQDDSVTLAKGEYRNIHFENIKGGHIEIADSTKISGMDIRGQHAHIILQEGSAIDHMQVDANTRILSLNMDKNSVIANSDLGQSTIAMNSHFEPGATFQSVSLNGNVAGLDFSGLKLNNVTIGGKPISHASQLAELGITYDSQTVATASPDLVQKYELAQVRNQMQAALSTIGQGEAAANAAPQQSAKGMSEQEIGSSIEEIGLRLRAAQGSIGMPLNPNEMRQLDAIHEANKVRTQDQGRTLSLPSRSNA